VARATWHGIDTIDILSHGPPAQS